MFEGADQWPGGLLGTRTHDSFEPGLGHVIVRVLFVVLLAAEVFTDATLGGVLQRRLLVAEDVRRLREQVIAQVHDHELGDSGLPVFHAGHCD